MLTWTERLPLRTGGARFVVWLFEPPNHRIKANRRVRARPWQLGSDLVTAALWRRSLRRAAVVLTGSQATADAIRDVVAARPLYPGLEPRFRPGPSEERDPYVLHIGSNDPRDDTATAIRAANGAGARLVVAGGWSGAAAEGVELVGRVSDERLVELYQGAAVFLDTSLYEGFGYQVLEAMACGTPVVASRATSLPELVGDAGLLCPPGGRRGVRGRARSGCSAIRRFARSCANAGSGAPGSSRGTAPRTLSTLRSRRRCRDRARPRTSQLGRGRGVRRGRRARARRAGRRRRAHSPGRPRALAVRLARSANDSLRPRLADVARRGSSRRCAALRPGRRARDRGLPARARRRAARRDRSACSSRITRPSSPAATTSPAGRGAVSAGPCVPR